MASGVGVGSGVHGISGPGVGQVTDGGVVGVGVGVTSSCSSDPSTYLTEPGTARITAEAAVPLALKATTFPTERVVVPLPKSGSVPEI